MGVDDLFLQREAKEVSDRLAKSSTLQLQSGGRSPTRRAVGVAQTLSLLQLIPELVSPA